MSPKKDPKVIGRYEVLGRLGRGGMGDVYRCRDPRMGGAIVAIKLLRISDEGLQERFFQEARAAGTLRNHRNIVTVYDCGDFEGEPFIVMEFIEGITLADQIRSHLQFSISRKLQIIEEVASGLEFAHEKGIVHRDVKPANLMIDRHDVVKILDFGIAHVGDSGLTSIGTMIGTPNYMSPEQVEGGLVDRRSDIFAVGLVLYELLSYRQAFPGDSVHAVISSIVRDAPPPLHDVCDGLDPALEQIVNRTIAKDPARRYQTMAAFAADVVRVRERIARGQRVSSDQSSVTLLTPPPISSTTERARPTVRDDRLSKRRAEAIETHLKNARGLYDAGDFAGAVEACEQAALFDANDSRVVELLERARTALERQQIRECLDEARVALDRRENDRALALVGRALALDPGSSAALALKATIEESRKTEESRQRTIESALVRARGALSSGNLESVIRAAGEILTHDPTHLEAHELTRAALRALDERRQREEKDKAARTAVDLQKREFAAGRHREAIRALELFTPSHEIVDRALEELRADLERIERQAAEEEARRRREEKKAEERRQAQARWAGRQIELAQSAIDSQQFEDAIEVLRHVENVVPDTPRLAALLETALAGHAAAAAAAQRQRESEQALATAEAFLAAGELTRARELVAGVLGRVPDHPDALDLRRRIEAAIDARRQQEDLDRRAAAAVDAARRQFDAGQHAEALAALEAFAPAHPLTAGARDELKLKLAEIAREAERVARAERLRQAIEHARDSVARAEFEEALQALEEAEALDRGNRTVVDLRARAREGLQEQNRQLELERRAREAVADARRQYSGGHADAAVALLESFVPAHPLVTEALSGLRDEMAALEERRAEEARLRAIEERRRLESEERARREAEARRVEEQRRVKEEEAKEAKTRLLRVEEQRRRAEAEQVQREREAKQAEERAADERARERREQVLAALGQAKRADSAAKAIAILKSALELEPDHRECRDLLAARQAEMLSAAERLLDNGEQNRAIALLDEMESLGVPASALAKLRARIEDASSPAQTRLHIPDADVLHQAPKFEHTIPAQRQDKELPRPAQPTQQAPPVSPASFVNGRTIGIGLVVLLLAGGGVWYWIRQAGRPDDLSTAITPSTTPVTPIVPPTVPAVQPTAPPIVPPTIPPTAPPTVPQKVSSVPPTVRPTISVAPTAPPTVQPTVQPTVPVTVAPTVATSVPVPRVTTTVPPPTSVPVSVPRGPADQAAIEKASQAFMTEYKSAYETMDAEAVGRLLSLPVERLKQVFGQARSYSVDFQCGPPTFRSDINATTTCQTAITAVMKVGDGRKTRQTSNRTLQLTKNGSSWSVASVQ